MISSKFGRMAVSIAALAMLSACSPGKPMSEEDLAQGHQFKPAYQVEQTVHRYLIPINPQKVDFPEQERRDLYDFLVGIGAQPGDSVVVGARRARLDHRGEIVEFVRRLGLKPDLRLIKEPKPGADDDGYDTAILIQFHRFVTRNPDCGNWHYSYSTRFYNTSPKDFGCSNTAGLQQQVAYPSSLVSGETLDFPEGDVAAESVSRYRGRTVEEIKVEAAASQ